MTSKHTYTRLPRIEEDQHEIERPRTYLASRTRLLLALATFGLTGALIVSLGFNVRLSSSGPPPHLSCGSSIAEAKRRGCTFDYLAKAWLHPQCPRVGMEDFLALGEESSSQAWAYWQDADAQSEWTDISKLADMEGAKWWTTDKEHLTHCAYLLIRQAEALHSGSRVDQLTANVDHTKHCALYLLSRSMEAPTRDLVTTEGNSFFGTC